MKCIHITCPNCKKTFEVEDNLIPSEGREVKCSACNIIWFYKKKKTKKKSFRYFKKVSK